MKYTFLARGHPNVTSQHKTTFEITMDAQIGKTADCVVGVSTKVSLDDLPEGILIALKNENQLIRVLLETENAIDEINGYGHPALTLDHPTDIVCRRSDYTCSRTLMIRADKAAFDLKRELVEDLKTGKPLKITIIV